MPNTLKLVMKIANIDFKTQELCVSFKLKADYQENFDLFFAPNTSQEQDNLGDFPKLFLNGINGALVMLPKNSALPENVSAYLRNPKPLAYNYLDDPAAVASFLLQVGRWPGSFLFASAFQISPEKLPHEPAANVRWASPDDLNEAPAAETESSVSAEPAPASATLVSSDSSPVSELMADDEDEEVITVYSLGLG